MLRARGGGVYFVASTVRHQAAARAVFAVQMVTCLTAEAERTAVLKSSGQLPIVGMGGWADAFDGS